MGKAVTSYTDCGTQQDDSETSLMTRVVGGTEREGMQGLLEVRDSIFILLGCKLPK